MTTHSPQVVLVKNVSGNYSQFKVHHEMLSEVTALVDRALSLIPDIERTPLTIAANYALDNVQKMSKRVKKLQRYCIQNSKLYMAVSGDLILSMCTNCIIFIEENLRITQCYSSVFLESTISAIVDAIEATRLFLDPDEEEAGKVLRELIKRSNSTSCSESDSMETSEIEALQFAASRLHILSPEDVLIEKRSIVELLRNPETEIRFEHVRTTKKTLLYLLALLNKYGNSFIPKTSSALKVLEDRKMSYSSNSTNSSGKKHEKGVKRLRPRKCDYDCGCGWGSVPLFARKASNLGTRLISDCPKHQNNNINKCYGYQSSLYHSPNLKSDLSGVLRRVEEIEDHVKQLQQIVQKKDEEIGRMINFMKHVKFSLLICVGIFSYLFFFFSHSIFQVFISD